MKPFASAAELLADLDADQVGRLLTAAGDLCFLVGADGVILDVAIGADAPLADDLDSWVGRPFLDTLAPDSRGKGEELMAEAKPAPGPWRQLNHLVDGREYPMQYRAARVDEGMLLIGRNLALVADLQQQLVETQQTLEQDYWRRRQVETRYRLLFQVASEAVLVVDADSQRIVEANPAAEALFQSKAADLVGLLVADCFEGGGREDLGTLLAGLRSTGGADSISIELAGSVRRVRVSGSLLNQSGAQLFLLRVSPEGARSLPAGTSIDQARLINVMESSPDAVVITDDKGVIQSCNRAFLELAELGAADQARGQTLDRWVGRTSVDVKVLISNLRQYGTLRHFTTRLRGEYGAEADVEISAATVRDAERFAFGFVIRDVSRRQAAVDSAASRAAPRSIEQLTELVGRVPLKEVVKESSDVIERLCIEAALELTGDNRASAAELLGLSRQSLYVKLRRHGLMNTDSGS